MKPKEKVFFEVKSVRASVTEREQKVFRRIEEQVKAIESRRSFEEKIGRASESEREQKIFRRIE